MSISTGPAPTSPPKKRGLGCLGCGCVVLGLLVVLFFVMMGSLAYAAYKMALDLTTLTPPAIATFDGGDDLYQKARQKLGDFDHDVENHQAATIRLSADELNTLIARDPNMVQNHLHAFLTLNDSEARLQASFPSELPSHGWLKGRYGSFDISFAVHLQAKGLEIAPHALAIGDKPFLGPDAANTQEAQTMIAPYLPLFNQSLTNGIRKNPDGALLLDQAKSIEIQNSQLVIETQ